MISFWGSRCGKLNAALADQKAFRNKEKGVSIETTA